MITRILAIMVWSLFSLAHLLLPRRIFLRRPIEGAEENERSEGNARQLATLYGSLAMVWGLSGALATSVLPPPAQIPAETVFHGLTPALIGLMVALEHAFVRREG
ncbi:MAG TPA: hypothetical protein ENN99_03080, partial [Chloroflexi bacterium]|nr:hypothetical protein [Chloroflexota bacterium]